MTTLPLSDLRFSLPTRQEVKRLMSDRRVMITALIVGGVVALGLIAAITYLVKSGLSPEALTTGLVGAVLLYLINTRSKVKDIHDDLKQQSRDS